MFDAKRLLDQLISSGAAGGFAGGLAGGALSKTLTGKKVKKFAGSALQLGGLALVGGLAFKAWQNYQRGSAAGADSGTATIPARSAFLPDSSDNEGVNALSLLLARATISAAKADGQIDAEESRAISQQINSSDLSSEDKAFLFEEYGKPIDIEGLTAVVDSPEHATEVYAASLLTLDPPSPAEKIYLDSLAKALALEPGLIGEIHATVQSDRAAA